MTNERPVNIKEAKIITGLSLITLYRGAAAGTIPSYKRGSRVFFFESELLAWIKSGKRKSQFEIDTAVDAAIASHK
ncbi:MAG: helix-turn-helix domain-containing protein [Niabella sp.]|nr:helix-turn-helix domain-containing protein [Niabella sp.]